MKRIAQDHLQTWFKKTSRLPLIISGARQVGKSTLVRLFCQYQGLDLIEVNLEKTKLQSTKNLDFNVEVVLDELQIKFKKRLQPHSLIFFDEIQEDPRLLAGLRYFFEERPDLAVIAAGSLLEILLKKENVSFPVGRVEFYYLGPMTFTEVLEAQNKDYLLEHLTSLKFSPAAHQESLSLLRTYYYTGGMPRAVSAYIEEKSLVPVRSIQEQIIETYKADFTKYHSRINVDRVERIFQAAPQFLGKKMIYQKLDRESKSRDIRRAVELLIDARVLLECQHSEATKAPLLGAVDSSIYKVYFLDIGLLNSMLGLDFDQVNEEFSKNFLQKGVLAEQFIVQHLAYLKPTTAPAVTYWLRDKGSQKGEIDFLLQHRETIVPVEVKATKSGHLKSLMHYMQERDFKFAIKFSLNEFSQETIDQQLLGQRVQFRILNLPHYVVESTQALIQKYF